MKRIKAACMEQTIHFMLKEDVPKTVAVKEVQMELKKYKELLDRKKTKYKVVEEKQQPDGSIMLKIKKQYNEYAIGDYLD